MENAKKLNRLNADFYAQVAESFSETRQTKWPGWDTLADYLAGSGFASGGDAASERSGLDGRCGCGGYRSPLRVLDVACGNMRFERYLPQRFPGCRFAFDAVDNCIPLVLEGDVADDVRFFEHDIVFELIDHAAGGVAPAAHPDYDLAVCFGFFHHVPTYPLRAALLRALVGSLRAGGVCCVSLWCFMDDARLAKKAREGTSRALACGAVSPADLERGDYLLGWKERDDVFRYCHHFDDEEVARLVKSVADIARLALEYRCDGKSGRLNTYLVFEKR